MRFLVNISLWLISVAFMTLITSCDAVMDGEHPCPAGESVSLSFKMITSNILSGTRADDLHTEVDSEFRSFEDGIDVNDLGLFIFARNADGSDRLVMKTTDIAASTDPHMMITGSPGAYTITMVIEKKDLSEILGREIDPNSGENVDFRIMILANCQNAISGGWNAINADTYEGILTQAQNIAFPMNAIYSGNEGDSGVQGLYKGYMPMFGTNRFTVSEQSLYESRPDERIWLGQVDMLRSLAKIRVIDNVQNKVDGYPNIQSVEFIGSQSFSIPIPANASAYVNGNQVHYANIYDFDKALTLEDAPVYKLGTISDDWDMTLEKDKTGLTRIGYVPEQKISLINGNISQGMPIFRITAALQKNADGTDLIKVYDVPMTGYYAGGETGINFNFGEYILRNHIYTLSVNRIAVGTPAELSIDVQPWQESTFNLDYTESIVIPNKLTWTPNTYESDNEGTVVVKPWTTTAEGTSTWVPLVGQFGIQSPVGATWTAYLLTLEGDEGAFAFLDNDSNLQPHLTGVVDGKTLSTIKIVTQDPEPSALNRARLQVVVTIGEGASATITEADLRRDGATYEYFTIVQNPL